MEMLEQIADAFVPILCLLITAGGGYLVALLRRQTQQIEKELNSETASKYIELATDAVEQAVTYTAQTFVDTLKAEGGFTKEKQLEAFQKARDKVLEILGDTTVKALGEIYGDFDAWLDTKIEQVCRDIKVPEVEKAATTTAAATAASVASTIATTAVQQIAAEATPASEPVETEEKNGIIAGKTRTTRKPGGRNPAGHFLLFNSLSDSFERLPDLAEVFLRGVILHALSSPVNIFNGLLQVHAKLRIISRGLVVLVGVFKPVTVRNSPLHCFVICVKIRIMLYNEGHGLVSFRV